MSDRLGPPPPTLEPGLEQQRERWREDKRKRREREVERASVVSPPPGDRYVMPRMPGTLPLIRRWLRQAHDAYRDRKISSAVLTEARRSAGAVSDLYRTGAELRKAEAAIRSAEASGRAAAGLTRDT